LNKIFIFQKYLEPALAALLVLLTSTNEIVLYSLNGIFLSSFNPGHTVKSIGVNSFTDGTE